MAEPNPTRLPDIESREDLRWLVDAFYGRVRTDDQLGFIFEDIAQVDWESHLPRMVDFWETIVFGTGAYRGNPLRHHRPLNDHVPMDWPRFQRWLQLFTETVDSRFTGPRATHIKNAATDMAQVLHRRIHEAPDQPPTRFAVVEKREP